MGGREELDDIPKMTIDNGPISQTKRPYNLSHDFP